MTDNCPIRVMLVDDQLLVRSGLHAILSASSHIELVGEAANGPDAICICERTQPDVVVMDLMAPGLEGIKTTCHIKQRCPKVNVLILTTAIDDKAVEDVLTAGAVGIVLKNISVVTFISAIQEASQGISTLAPEVTRALIRLHTHPPEMGHDLTQREQEVLALLADGLSNYEIAVQFHISYSTVQFHVSNILSKLGVSNRVEAVAFAIRHKLA